MPRILPFLIWALVAPAAFADQKSGSTVLTQTRDCFCNTADGRQVAFGSVVCLTVGGRSFLARCDMVLNNTAWRDTGQICPMSSLSDRLFDLLDKPINASPV